MEVINWPIVTGCFRISEGCYSCPSFWEYTSEGKDYAPVCHPEQLDAPKKRASLSVYEVAFGSDLFEKNVPQEFIEKAFQVMNECPQHVFEIGTKRIDRVNSMSHLIYFSPNISLGVAVENENYLWRIDALREVSAATKYVSMVPVLGPMGKLDLRDIDLVMAAKETWGYKRPAKQEWIDDIKNQCEEQGVVFSQETIVYDEGGKIK